MYHWSILPTQNKDNAQEGFEVWSEHFHLEKKTGINTALSLLAISAKHE